LQKRGNQQIWFKSPEYPFDVHFKLGTDHGLGELNPEDRANELIWNTNYTPRSDYYGAPDIMPAIGAIHGDIARRDYNIAFFDNYGVPSYAVFITGDFDEGIVDEATGLTPLESEIQGHFDELAKNPHSALILSVPSRQGGGEVKIEFKPLSVETKEASFRLYRTDNRDEVLAAHGVPPYRAGIAETGSLGGSTAAESTEIYKDSVINPRQERWESLFNRYIVQSWEITEFEFKLIKIDTRDVKKELDVVGKLFDMGAMTPNQIIMHFGKQFGLEEVDHPAMNANYIKGKAINLKMVEEEEGQADEVEPIEEVRQIAEIELESVLQSFQMQMLELAKKHDEREQKRHEAAMKRMESGE
jgi:capsid portal protein